MFKHVAIGLDTFLSVREQRRNYLGIKETA